MNGVAALFLLGSGAIVVGAGLALGPIGLVAAGVLCILAAFAAVAG